ncbi:RNA polymerase sigma factor [Dehalobacterium formicoaceticum]|uniref:RNA polymerase sigma factor n=1 Tax=Dehalobacterium formicoaceticum TaxID=51515 RepID=A0ABT1Y493_9FIRM|nr:RNA polymerase sigma factor [Dehalobacterium formicoaceticum]MCR6545703.1 RNA polymerase sigma factor [Dehalobacterium formicoaceticum]
MGDNSLLRTDKELAEMYRRNVNRVYKLCYIYLKNTADAEDAVQSVFLKVLQLNLSFNDYEHEKAWFITTTKNCCKDILKSWWKRQRVDFETLPDIASQDEDTQEKVIIAKLLALPEKYRVVLYLYYLEDYSVKEIAKFLGRNESTIRSQLQRGRQKLKIDLGGKDLEQKSCEQNI